MRVAYLVNYCNTQLSFEEAYLPVALSKLGHKVRIITSNRFFPFDFYKETIGHVVKDRILPKGKVDFNGVELVRLGVIFEMKKRKQVFVRGLSKALREFNPDIVHALNPMTTMTLFSVILQKKFGYTLVMDSHLEQHNLRPFTLGKRIGYSVAKYLFYGAFKGRISLFLAISEEARDLLVKLFGIQQFLIRIKHLSADIERFYLNTEKRAKIRQDLGINPSDILLITAGKITPGKKIDAIIETVLPIFYKYPNMRLLILGGGSGVYMNKLKNLSGKFLNNRIIFKDFVANEQLPDYLSAADMGVWFQFSQVVIEAMSMSLPLIVSDAKNMAYLCGGGNGFVVSENDLTAFSSALEQVAQKNYDLKRMGAASRSLVEERFSLMKNALKCQSFYEEAIKLNLKNI